MSEQVVDRPEKSRFELEIDGATAFAEYRLAGKRIILTHTEVPEALSGRGVGSRLAKGVFEAIRDRGLKAEPLCEFMAGWVAKHREFASVLDG